MQCLFSKDNIECQNEEKYPLKGTAQQDGSGRKSILSIAFIKERGTDDFRKIRPSPIL
jgi:hypothetical protein